MNTRTILLTTAAACFAACSALADETVVVRSGPVNAQGVAPKFAVIRRTPATAQLAAPVLLPKTWKYSLKNAGATYTETFIGTAPGGGLSTTIPVYIVPIKVVYGTTSYDPTAVTANGVSVIQNVLNSPIFAKSIDYVQGSTDLGTTQYLDAFQRATLWGSVKNHPTYHVLLTTTVEPVQTVTIPAANGKIINAFGATNLIMANINTFDPLITAKIAALKIPKNALPLFITTQTYLSESNATGGCCIGGYHSVSSIGQPYADSTYITTAGAFAQNVGALSHEIGEWIDDPNTNNPVPPACGAGAVLEVGDPLENNANYGDYAYTVGGVTWDLQDLALLPYFGAPASTSVNKWSTFQGETLPFCSQGG